MFNIKRAVTPEEDKLLRTMASDPGTDDKTKKRALAVVSFLDARDLKVASSASGIAQATVRKILRDFDAGGWQASLSVSAPRGGDFLARYDQGFWAERLIRVYLERSRVFRPIPYGTSRSEPFTDMQTFRNYRVNEALLQAWSAGQRWKRPDLLLIPREVLRGGGGTDEWTPDLLHLDNSLCTE
ncbi:MAG TPA: hypothetical protein VKO18_11790 [Terriglobia bacterium]|nr:hypothetical protein [Terriglobia bacterium]